MMTSTREPAQQGGRDHRNPWPASIGTGGRLRAESPADFVGMRKMPIPGKAARHSGMMPPTGSEIISLPLLADLPTFLNSRFTAGL